VLKHRRAGEAEWSETEMEPLVNDRWRAEFIAAEVGSYEYTVEAWVDHFRTWRDGLEKKSAAGKVEAADVLIGAELAAAAANRAQGIDGQRLADWADELKKRPFGPNLVDLALDPDLARIVDRHPDRSEATDYHLVLKLWVDREKAAFSAWYEMFPRSASPDPGRHGTFQDVEARLPYVAEMGFDVLYLPPIHPIGRTHRKGPNNQPSAGPGDPGSPWAIGAREGGHKSVHPELGTMKDFERLIQRAKEHGLEIAMDVAFQCSPDHPWVTEHPEWFRWRPDGTVQYAENPPKKYEDIYPFDFETDDWRALWKALLEVFLFWAGKGIRIFRVDNPHTKPFHFWEWAIEQIQSQYPDALFLAEAFTRPKVMYRLAKLGFSQSYTYFAWRNTAWEIERYFTELTRTGVVDFFRPNPWPNTPDILTEHLQIGGRPAFMTRLILAATLGANYGIYGPPFELLVNEPREFGSEEYLDSEKYQVHHWDLDRPGSLKDFIGRINRIRRQNPALRRDRTLAFHAVDNDQMLAYSKTDPDGDNVVLVVASLDPHYAQSCWVDLDLDELGLEAGRPFQVHDLLTDARYLWTGAQNYLQLDPASSPGHIFRLRRKLRTERDFDYFM
jgi:starch synthase (maltosyl-transferring)